MTSYYQEFVNSITTLEPIEQFFRFPEYLDVFYTRRAVKERPVGHYIKINEPHIYRLDEYNEEDRALIIEWTRKGFQSIPGVDLELPLLEVGSTNHYWGIYHCSLPKWLKKLLGNYYIPQYDRYLLKQFVFDLINTVLQMPEFFEDPRFTNYRPLFHTKGDHSYNLNVRPLASFSIMMKILEGYMLLISYRLNASLATDWAFRLLRGGYHDSPLNNFQLLGAHIYEGSPERVAIFFDITNAYGSVNHQKLMEVLDKGPDWAPLRAYVNNFYRKAYCDGVGPVRRGLLQGSALANRLFLYYMASYLETTREALRIIGATIRAFVDDIIVFCPASRAHLAREILSNAGAHYGFLLNASKERFLRGGGSTEPLEGFIPVEPGFKYLGALVAPSAIETAYQFYMQDLMPIMEIIDTKPLNKMRYFVKSILPRVWTMFKKTYVPNEFLDHLLSLLSVHLYRWTERAPEMLWRFKKEMTEHRGWLYSRLQVQDNRPADLPPAHYDAIVHLMAPYQGADWNPYGNTNFFYDVSELEAYAGIAEE